MSQRAIQKSQRTDKRQSINFFFYRLSVVSLSFKHRVSALTFGMQGLLITACWIPVNTLQLVSKAFKVLETRKHNASAYFQIPFTLNFAVLRKIRIMFKFLSYPFTPILYVLYSCLVSQVSEQKLMLLTHLFQLSKLKAVRWARLLPPIHFFFMCNWVERGRMRAAFIATVFFLPQKGSVLP